MNKRDYIYGQESKNSGYRYNSEYSRDNDSYSRKNNNSYKKVQKIIININLEVELLVMSQKKNQFLLNHLRLLIQINQIYFIHIR